ncbi:hypothetical protein PaecuDRAFT_0999 [Paenibacillus curdlanolyticus YK9]|uniref:Uncharacterized protein n=1 Tax=Paenibacillus curdlanolyticus YK9 TaxID=717606 RepID=E0I5S7_9BACL|nr:hypothetical protein [Paenibacillus curdlanolyticus]EFM12319.1 hypothetical protein PaecuDRAFT_0999 [Paenibacillus curdlanolyticus YK9]
MNNENITNKINIEVEILDHDLKKHKYVYTIEEVVSSMEDIISETPEMTFKDNTSFFDEDLVSIVMPGMDCSWRGCKFYRVKHRIHATVSYPNTIEDAAKNVVKNCFNPFQGTFVYSISESLGEGFLNLLKYDVTYDSHKV